MNLNVSLKLLSLILLTYVIAPMSSCAQSAFELSNGASGDSAVVLPPLVNDDGLAVIEISAPGWWKASNTKYVLTQDIESAGTALMFGEKWSSGISNCIIDLNGHTITFNTANSEDLFGIYGIFLATSTNCRVINGTIRQGNGYNGAYKSEAIKIGLNSECENLTIETHRNSVAIHAGGNGGRVYNNYFVCDDIQYGSNVVWLDRATNWDVYNNTIVGGHNGVFASPSGNTPYDAHHKIHHNKIFNTKRTLGYKAPAAIHLYAASGIEVFENSIITMDARGIIVQMGSSDCETYNNDIEARYSRFSNDDSQGNYAENNAYGIWQRHGYNNKFYSNRIVVNCYIDDILSRAWGMFIENGDDNIGVFTDCNYNNNTIVARKHELKGTSYGLHLRHMGTSMRIYNNEIYSKDRGADVLNTCSGVNIHDNAFLKPQVDSYTLISGETYSDFQNNTDSVLNKNLTPPKTPTGLNITGKTGAIKLQWNKNQEKDVFEYNIYRNGTKINEFKNGGSFFIDTSPEATPSSSYTVTAVNLSGVESVGQNKPMSPVLRTVK